MLTVGMLYPADGLLQAMKAQIDSILAHDEELQRFLSWVEQKSNSVDAPYKPAAIRAFYMEHYDLLYAFDRSLSRDLALYFEPAIDPEVNLAYDNFLEDLRLQEMDSDFKLSEVNNISTKKSSPSSSNTSLNWNLALDSDLQNLLSDCANEVHAEIMHLHVHHAMRFCEKEAALKQELELLVEQLSPYLEDDWKSWYKWWQLNEQTWVGQLRAVTIKYRNIGHDWQFTQAQRQLLQQYYDANRLLVDCLNSDCYVSREVREEIEGGVLLPAREQGTGNREQEEGEL